MRKYRQNRNIFRQCTALGMSGRRCGIESKIKRKNVGVAVCGSADYRNCPFYQYFSGANGTWYFCDVFNRCDYYDSWHGVFQLGAEVAMTPIGEGIGVQISKTRRIALIILIGFIMGVIITISEPDLQVLAEQVPSVPNYTLILTVAVGVGIFLALAIIRILFQINLSITLIVLYLILIGASFLVPEEFLAVAFDSGGVTTGPMTVPFIMAMGVGLASVRSDKNAASDSFGLVALSSVGPVIAVLILGCFLSQQKRLIRLQEQQKLLQHRML